MDFTEEGAAVTGAVSISDPDNLNLASVTVSVHGRPGTRISTSYDSSNERLVLSGSDKVTFAARENPNNFGSNPTRTVTWLLDDGSGSSATSTVATTTVSITNAERKIRGFGGSSSAAPASRARLVNGRTTSVIANMVLAGLATVQAICKRVPVPSQLFLPTHNQRCMRPPI